MNDVRVLLFARVRELAGRDSMTLNLNGGATVADLRSLLEATVPALRALLPRCAVGINGTYAADEVGIPAGAEVAILPPVSGGSDG